jgi:hypothetical protein
MLQCITNTYITMQFSCHIQLSVLDLLQHKKYNIRFIFGKIAWKNLGLTIWIGLERVNWCKFNTNTTEFSTAVQVYLSHQTLKQHDILTNMQVNEMKYMQILWRWPTPQMTNSNQQIIFTMLKRVHCYKILHWMNHVNKITFPIYLSYWAN